MGISGTNWKEAGVTLAENLPIVGWNNRDLTGVTAAMGIEVRRLLGPAFEDESTAPVRARADEMGRVRVPVFFTALSAVTNQAGRALSYSVTATCADTPGFETSPCMLQVQGVAAGEQITLTGTHGMSTIPAAVYEYAEAYGSILVQRMERMGVKSKSMGNVNVSYTDGTGYSPEQEALQITGSAVLAYRLEPLTPSLELSEAGWWGE